MAKGGGGAAAVKPEPRRLHPPGKRWVLETQRRVSHAEDPYRKDPGDEEVDQR